MLFAAEAGIGNIQQALEKVSDSIFGWRSLAILVLCLIIGSAVGKLCALLLRKVSKDVGKRADAATDLAAVNRLRRIETWTIISIAAVRLVFILFGLYFWWVLTHPAGSQSGALIGASAVLVILLGGVFGPLLRDFAFGSGMMAEHWFGVGDLVTVEPFPNMQGVVERITLRSTRIRGLNGEIIWVANQNIQAVRVAQKGVWTMAIELFVTDPDKAELLIDKTNALLPTGPSLIATKLHVMTADEHDDKVWHLTAIGETAPGREWLIEKTAIELLKSLDEKAKEQVLLADPVARFADNDTERQFARAVTNAKKKRRHRTSLSKVVKARAKDGAKSLHIE